MVWRRATAMRWSLQIAHIKGSFNVIADQLSRDTILWTEWPFQKEDFLRILAQKRNIQVDLFATSLNNKLKTFVYPWPDQQAAGVDAMIIPWDKWEHLYLFPPTVMISKALAKLSETKFLTAILITPNHPTRPWFMALSQRHIQSSTMTVKLQQKVGNRMVIAQQHTTLVTWRLSGESMGKDCQAANKK